MAKAFFITVGALLILFIGFVGVNFFIYNQKQADPSATVEPYRGTLSGEYACVPSEDPALSEGEECVLGLKTEAGEYYLVDFNLMSQGLPPELKANDRISGNGIITPIEMLSTDQWQKYELSGIFSVTDSFQKL